MKTEDLLNTQCQHTTEPLSTADITTCLGAVHADWATSDDGKAINRRFAFKNYYQTMAFVNALAWVAHEQDHHPDLEVGYNRCTVHFSTHSAGGLSNNDFICAARIDRLLKNHA